MQNRKRLPAAASLAMAGVLCAWTAWAAGVPGNELEQVVVLATRTNVLAGAATSASQGTVLAEQLENRPVLRTGEVLEVVPGLVVTQHSGDGKANQHFLRGFNLDHGTDLASYVEGMPVNMPTHAHGQGYSDINFLIPELVDRIEYKKDTYYAEEGNFSAAGAVHIVCQRALEQKLVQATTGSDDYLRGLFAGSTAIGNGDLLIGLDSTYSNGPWQLKQNMRKFNGVLKYTQGTVSRGYSIEAMGYDGKWRATDQIPLRAVQAGSIDRYGNIDPTDGGETHRYSLSAATWSPLGSGNLNALLYGIDYGLDLLSNSTYFTDSVQGDQFEQYDDRRILGANLSYSRPWYLFGKTGEFTAGVQMRYDDIAPVGLYRTTARERYATVREDSVQQTSYGLYARQDITWADWLRMDIGVRFDRFQFAVDSSLAPNSGHISEQITSPKLTLILGPWHRTEYFVNWGQGFHSNDARGATTTVDPSDGFSPADRVTPLVRATGEEIGLRSAVIPHLQLAASLWTLKLDSELLFVGDGGSTEASRASRRTGVELSAYYTPLESLIVDADFAWSRSRFSDRDPAGDHIPNAVKHVMSMGVTYNRSTGWFGGARLRHLGPAPLVEDNSVTSSATTLVNVDVGYHVTRHLTATVTLLNAFNKKANDITYYYESKLANESDPVSDIHFHPVEPREVRFTLTGRF
jgi:TonB dependent receptor-like, beta-barrel/TonB-dependent Receptor Plug Domain